MQNKYIDSLEKLIPTLEKYSVEGFHFRGQRDARWPVRPAIFRPNRLRDYIKQIPASSNYLYPFHEKILNEWFDCKEILSFASLILFKGKRKILTYRELHPKVQNLFKLAAFLLEYNFYLGLYVCQNPNQHDFDEKTLKLCEIPYQQYAKKEKFIAYIQYALPKLIDIFLLNGNVFQKGRHDNVLTGYNQTFAQHYDFPTAAIDLTECFLVALHFAIDKGDTNDSKCFSVFAYKQLNFAEDTSCFLHKGDELRYNKRAQAQKGSFLYFRNPCTHFLEKGEFPSLDKYVNDCINFGLPLFADVIKFNIPYNEGILGSLRPFLISNKITTQRLKPDNAYLPTLA